MRQSHTAVIERNVLWTGPVATEPYEAGWASEALFFVRVLAPRSGHPKVRLQVQISPDGMHWCDEGTTLEVHADAPLSWCRVVEFGNWLRLAGSLPVDMRLTVMVYLQLKV